MTLFRAVLLSSGLVLAVGGAAALAQSSGKPTVALQMPALPDPVPVALKPATTGLLVLDYVIVSVEWRGGLALAFRAALFALTVLLAFHTSRVGATVQNAVRVLVALTFS